MTTDSFLKSSPTSSKFDMNADPNLNKIRHLIENFNIREFYELAVGGGERERKKITRKLTILIIRCILQKASDNSVLN